MNKYVDVLDRKLRNGVRLDETEVNTVNAALSLAYVVASGLWTEKDKVSFERLTSKSEVERLASAVGRWD